MATVVVAGVVVVATMIGPVTPDGRLERCSERLDIDRLAGKSS